MNISSAVFHCSAPDLDSCPDESLPEFAFIGRSNVGKSSLVNMLAGANELARVSPTPGHTKLINFFTMNGDWRLVDLPGYGFAQVAREHKAKFNRSVNEYLAARENLCCVFALIDSGLPPQKLDLEFLEWLAENEVPFVLVFTKTDKNSATAVQANIAAFQASIAEMFEKPPEIFTCSAREKLGRSELLGVVAEGIQAFRNASPDSEPDEEMSAPESPTIEPPSPPAHLTKKARAELAKPKRPNPHRPW